MVGTNTKEDDRGRAAILALLFLGLQYVQIKHENLMSAPIETEMNLIITDKSGLLEFLKAQADVKRSQIQFDYYGKPGDKSFYVRVEQRTDAAGTVTRFVTAKGSFVSNDGINQRKEVTLAVPDNAVSDYRDFLELVQLQSRDTKTKTRHAFDIDGLDVTVDEWDTPELGDRLEIEGTDMAKIKDFASRVSAYCQPESSE